jgi:hypothetical protein
LEGVDVSRIIRLAELGHRLEWCKAEVLRRGISAISVEDIDALSAEVRAEVRAEMVAQVRAEMVAQARADVLEELVQ